MKANNSQTIGLESLKNVTLTSTDLALSNQLLKNELKESIHDVESRLRVLENTVNERNKNFNFTVNSIISIIAILVTIAIPIIGSFF